MSETERQAEGYAKANNGGRVQYIKTLGKEKGTDKNLDHRSSLSMPFAALIREEAAWRRRYCCGSEDVIGGCQSRHV